MPIYEFYCKNCNTIYKFFSRTINTEKIPHCPECDNADLKKMASTFATLSGKKEGSEGQDDQLPQFDEAKMEKAMSMLMKDVDKINEDDPRQAASFMRKLTEATGMNMGPGMEEALHRMERGEDPDKIEEEMGDLLEQEDPFLFNKQKKKLASSSKPKTDETIYDL